MPNSRDYFTHKDYVAVADAQAAGLTYEQIARVQTTRIDREYDTYFTVTGGMIDHILREIRSGAIQLDQETINPQFDTYTYGIEKPKAGALPVFTGQPTHAGNALLLGDLHSPYMHWGYVELALERGRRAFDLTEFVLGGDALDGNYYSRYPKQVYSPPAFLERSGLAQFLTLAKRLGYRSGKIHMGNHDKRYVYHAEGQFTLAEVLSSTIADSPFEGMLEVSEYDRTRLTYGPEELFFTHQVNYAKQPLKVARDLAAKFEANVVTAHQHHTAKGYSLNGRHVVADIGGLYDTRLLGYVMLNTSTASAMVPGFGSWVDGRLEVIAFDHKFTNWQNYDTPF